MNVIQRIVAMRERHVKQALKRQQLRLGKARELEALVRKKHGKEAMRLMTSEAEIDVPCVSTLRQEFDDWLSGADDASTGDVRPGSGLGIPRGRIIEVYGPESSGKTTLTLDWIAAIQKQGGLAAFIDAEHAFDPKWARKQGVNTSELLLSQPDSGEEALQIVLDLVGSGDIDVVVVDSVAALTPKKELSGDMDKLSVGAQAAMMSKHLRKLKGLAFRKECIVVFINQIRMKIGVMFGNPETTPGGQALKFYSSVRIDVRRVATLKKTIKGKERSWAVLTKAKTVKNKVAPPFRTLKFCIEFDKGITQAGDDL